MSTSLRLSAFGGLSVVRSDAGPVGLQRRPLALLSILAVAGESGVSRDRVLLLLWPDTDTNRARHALTQTLYQARRSLACDDLVLAGADLALNPARISSDVADFERAVSAAEHAVSARLYAGPFLDDFVLPGAGEFERWVTEQRLRYASVAMRSFDILASSAADTGDSVAELGWRRRRLEVDPLHSGAALALATALADSGDRVGALREVRSYEARLRAELDVEPDHAIREFHERLKSRPPERLVEPVHTTAGATPEVVIRREVRNTRWRRSWLGAAVVAAAVAITAAIIPFRRAPQPDLADQRVVVAPFRVSGADASLAFLREGIVELLSIRLGGGGGAIAVDAGSVIRAWRTARLSEAPDVPRAEIARLARTFSAAGVVVGSVVGNPQRVVVTASFADAAGQPIRSAVTVEGPLDSLTSIVDRLAARLLMDRAGEQGRLVDRSTPSLDALKAYLAGQAAYRGGDFQLALAKYEAALENDSTFALAAFQLALTADRVNVSEQHDQGIAVAWRYRADLNERDRAHLTAFAGPRYPFPSTEAEHVEAWESAVALSPYRAETWLELGERFFHSGDMLNLRDHDHRAELAFRQAASLNPADAAPRELMALLAAHRGDSLAVHNALVERRGIGFSPAVGWRMGLAANDSAMLLALRRRMPQLDDATLRFIAMSSQYDAVGMDDGERALTLRGRRNLDGAARLDEILARHSLALNQGRAIVALDLSEQLEELQPSSRAHLRLRVLDALYGGGDTSAAVAAARLLAPIVDGPRARSATARAIQQADICVVAQWRLSRGDVARPARSIAALREGSVPRGSIPVAANSQTCAALVEAQIAVAMRGQAATAMVEHVDSLMLGGPAASDASTYSHIVVARLWEQLGRRDRALDAVRRRAYMSGWPRYLATARRYEGRLAELTGDSAGALAAYGQYLAMRARPEAPAAKEIDSVRSAYSVIASPGRPLNQNSR